MTPRVFLILLYLVHFDEDLGGQLSHLARSVLKRLSAKFGYVLHVESVLRHAQGLDELFEDLDSTEREPGRRLQRHGYRAVVRYGVQGLDLRVAGHLDGVLVSALTQTSVRIARAMHQHGQHLLEQVVHVLLADVMRLGKVLDEKVQELDRVVEYAEHVVLAHLGDEDGRGAEYGPRLLLVALVVLQIVVHLGDGVLAVLEVLAVEFRHLFIKKKMVFHFPLIRIPIRKICKI
jgi:hypothetical protein